MPRSTFFIPTSQYSLSFRFKSTQSVFPSLLRSDTSCILPSTFNGESKSPRNSPMRVLSSMRKIGWTCFPASSAHLNSLMQNARRKYAFPSCGSLGRSLLTQGPVMTATKYLEFFAPSSMAATERSLIRTSSHTVIPCFSNHVAASVARTTPAAHLREWLMMTSQKPGLFK